MVVSCGRFKVNTKKLEHKWVKVFGIPLHAWSLETFKFIEENCGGYVGVDEDTKHIIHFLWAQICVGKHKMVISRSIELLKKGWIFKISIMVDLHTSIRLAGKNPSNDERKVTGETGISKLVPCQEVQCGNFNLKATNGFAQ